MSLSKPRSSSIKNPAEKFHEWKGGGDQGYFQHYDKSIKNPDGSIGANVRSDLNSGFAVLDMDLISITGYDTKLRAGITSNEVVKNTNQKLIVKMWKDGKTTVLMEGTYLELKEKIDNDSRLHYTSCNYIMNKGKLEHLKLTGSCLGSWFDDIAKKQTSAWVMHVDTKDGKNGAVEYKFPIFAYGKPLTDMEYEAAYEIDSKILQPFLESYLGSSGVVDNSVNQESKEELTVDEWRKVKSPSGDSLGKLCFQDLSDLSDSIDPDSPLQDYIQKAIQEYITIQKTWKDKKDKSGKTLSEYSLDDIEALMKLIVDGNKWTNPSKQFFEVAISEKKLQSQNKFAEVEVLDEEDDIPF